MPSAVADDVEDAFRAALEQDAGITPGEPDAPPPPPRKPVIADPDAPHGRDDHGAPLAPFGVNKKTGKPNLRRPGKPPKDDQPRVKADTVPAGDGRPAVKRDWSGEISDLVDGVWMLMSSAPVPLARLKTRVHAQAALLNGNKPGIVKGVNLMAQNNEVIARGVEKLTTGNVSWVLPAMFALGPFVAQSAVMWRSEIGEETQALASSNDDAWAETVKVMQLQLAAWQAEEMA